MAQGNQSVHTTSATAAAASALPANSITQSQLRLAALPVKNSLQLQMLLLLLMLLILLLLPPSVQKQQCPKQMQSRRLRHLSSSQTNLHPQLHFHPSLPPPQHPLHMWFTLSLIGALRLHCFRLSMS